MKTNLAALVALLCTTAPNLAQDGTFSDEDVAAALQFSMGDAAYTMYHEIGHLLINELGLPVLGKEEDAADALAVIMLLNDDSDDSSYIRLIDAADGWYFKAHQTEITGMDDLSYYDEHSLGIQRAFAMACMMLGKDQDYFSSVAEFYNIDQESQDRCVGTYEETERAWNSVLETHLLVDEASADIEVIYEDPGEGYEIYADALKEAQILEHAAELVSSTYVLPRPVVFRAMMCDEANAYYSSEGEVTYCYELAEDMANLYLSDIIQYYTDDSEDEAAEESE